MGRQKNPCGADGHAMRCTGKSGRFSLHMGDTCHSEYHLKAECPRFASTISLAGPFGSLQSLYTVDAESIETKIKRHSAAQDLLDNHFNELAKEVAKNQQALNKANGMRQYELKEFEKASRESVNTDVHANFFTDTVCRPCRDHARSQHKWKKHVNGL